MKTEEHIKAKKCFRYFPSPLLFYVFLCAVVFGFLFLSTECARACSLSAEPIPDPAPNRLGGDLCWEKYLT